MESTNELNSFLSSQSILLRSPLSLSSTQRKLVIDALVSKAHLSEFRAQSFLDSELARINHTRSLHLNDQLTSEAQLHVVSQLNELEAGAIARVQQQTDAILDELQLEIKGSDELSEDQLEERIYNTVASMSASSLVEFSTDLLEARQDQHSAQSLHRCFQRFITAQKKLAAFSKVNEIMENNGLDAPKSTLTQAMISPSLTEDIMHAAAILDTDENKTVEKLGINNKKNDMSDHPDLKRQKMILENDASGYLKDVFGSG